jgi:AraC-like DNA-binding protein
MPLVFHDRRAVVDRDPEALASRLAQHYRLLDFGPRQGWERQFLHRSSSAAAGDLILSCGCSTPIQGAIDEHSGVGSINLCFGGSISYEVDGLSLQITQEQPIFFASGHSYRYSVDHFNGIVFDVDLGRLKATASAMAGFGVSARRFCQDMDRPTVLSVDGGRTAQRLNLLRRTCSLLDDLDPADAVIGRTLQIDDLIYRTLALLLFPRLDALLEAPSAADVARERIFEELLEWVSANLETPINLTTLEQRSGYSRRFLQQAFQQRFGCGPMQWVRLQRLEQARLLLLNPDNDLTVAAVAARFGFGSLSAFSRDFHHQFGLRPSDLLREGRRFSP